QHSRRAKPKSKRRTGPISRADSMVEPTLGSAEVAEQADASVSKTDVRKDVRVRLPLSAPRRYETGWTVIRLHPVDIARSPAERILELTALIGDAEMAEIGRASCREREA